MVQIRIVLLILMHQILLKQEPLLLCPGHSNVQFLTAHPQRLSSEHKACCVVLHTLGTGPQVDYTKVTHVLDLAVCEPLSPHHRLGMTVLVP